MRYVKELCVIGTLLALTGLARAVSVTYSVEGWGPNSFPAPTQPADGATWGPNGYPGDTVWLDAFSATVDLPLGVSLQKINTLNWTIDYTYQGTSTDPDAQNTVPFTFDVARDMTIGGTTISQSQTAHLAATWFFDSLSVDAGTTSTFYIPGYQIDVMPQSVPAVTSEGEPYSALVMAQFSVTAVPLPSAAGIGLSMLGGFGALAGLRKRLSRKARMA